MAGIFHFTNCLLLYNIICCLCVTEAASIHELLVSWLRLARSTFLSYMWASLRGAHKEYVAKGRTQLLRARLVN
jgi:hypothetical protein